LPPVAKGEVLTVPGLAQNFPMAIGDSGATIASFPFAAAARVPG
jgi:hypothetical protein